MESALARNPLVVMIDPDKIRDADDEIVICTKDGGHHFCIMTLGKLKELAKAEPQYWKYWEYMDLALVHRMGFTVRAFI